MMHPAKITLLSLALLLAGCGVKAEFGDRPTEQVWRALQAVAEQPDYDHEDYTKRWTVVENIVTVDEADRRIDIERELERVLVRPRTKPLHQEVHWSIQVTLLPGNEVLFESVDPEIPAHVQLEADRYFTSVRRLLAGLPPPDHIRDRMQAVPIDEEEGS